VHFAVLHSRYALINQATFCTNPRIFLAPRIYFSDINTTTLMRYGALLKIKMEAGDVIITPVHFSRIIIFTFLQRR
jgi:hypothetical protein